MKTVVLDCNTVVSNGDISLEPICALGDTFLYDMLSEDEILQVAEDADAIICNKANMNSRVIDHCKKLKYIGLFATGYNNVDLDAATKRGIAVCNVPDYSTHSVTQHTIGLMLSMAGSICAYDRSVHSGDWCRSAAFTYLTEPMCEVRGKTLGIFGFGAIGKSVAKVADALGMKVIVCTRTQRPDCPYEYVSKEELFKNSDFLTLHCPLTDSTRQLVNKDTLSLMKNSAYIINTSRGGVINEADLIDALNSGKIAGAAIDVAVNEPMKEGDPLLNGKNLIITPHVAWATPEARRRLVGIVAKNLESFMQGAPQNCVNLGEANV